MGAAWLDVVAGGDVEAVLAELGSTVSGSEPARLQAWRRTYDGGSRVEVYSDASGYDRLGDLVATVVRRTDLVWRAVVFLDHDEYGAEHLVLAPDGTGQARRVHHVYVYPYDEDSGEYLIDGEPSLTDVPAVAGAGPGGTPGALIDDPTARMSTARLFGITAERMRAAAGQAAGSHRGLQIVGAPVQPWLDAFGIGWVGTGGGAPVNLRPGPVWRDAVADRVVPRLPGTWLARDYDLVRLPASPVMCVVLAGSHGGHAAVYPMYVPDVYGTLRYAIPLRQVTGDTPPDPDALVRELRDDALPFFDRHGHPDGLRRLCRERTAGRAADRVDPHDLRCRAATEVILGRYVEAATTYAALAAALTGEAATWARDIAEEAYVRSRLLHHDPTVVHDALTDTIARQLDHLGVP
jgi:hypothetical protein